MPLGKRQEILLANFRSVDPLRDGIYVDTYDPPQAYAEGVLADACGCRFSSGRVHWYRHQIYLHLPLCGVASCALSFTPDYIERSGDGYCHIHYVTAPLSAAKRVLVLGSGDWEEDGVHALEEPYGSSQMDFYWATTNAQRSRETVPGLTVYPETALLFGYYSPHGEERLFVISNLGSFWRSVDFRWRDLEVDMWGYRVVASDDWRPAVEPIYNWGPTGQATLQADFTLHQCGPPVIAGEHVVIVGGRSAKWPTGLPTLYWDGSQLRELALYPPYVSFGYGPTILPASSGDALPPGTYAYRVAYYDGRVESPAVPNPATWVASAAAEAIKAAGHVYAASASTPPQHEDTLAIGGVTYRFIDGSSYPNYELQPYDIWLSTGTLATARTYQLLAEAITTGLTQTRADGRAVYTPPHPTVTARYTTVSGSPGCFLEAREPGEAGNSITLETSSGSPPRIILDGSALSGGRALFRIRLNGLPTAHPRATHLRIYRSYTPQVGEGVASDDWFLLATVPLGSSAYDDNTPPEALAQLYEEGGGPPRGAVAAWWSDRCWIGGVSHPPEATRRYGTFTNATLSDGVLFVTVGEGHGVNVGDVVSIWSTADDEHHTFRPYATAYVTDVSATGFTCTHPGLWTNPDVAAVDTPSDGSTGGGVYAVLPAAAANALYYSAHNDIFRWPVENVIFVGDDKPIIGLVPYEDRLVILKSSQVWELRGYGEGEWRLTQVSGTTGVRWGRAAASPYGILWCGHGGWELYDGTRVRLLLPFVGSPNRSTEAPEVTPPCEPTARLMPPQSWHVCAWHAGRFYMLTTPGRALEYEPESNTFTVRSLDVLSVGLQRITTPHGDTIATVCRQMQMVNHLTLVDWAWDALREGDYAYYRGQYPNPNEVARGVRVELPPLLAPPGCVVQPLEFVADVSWIKPTYWSASTNEANDLHLYISTAGGQWTDLGVFPADGRVALDGSYAGACVRFALQGQYTERFVLHSVRVIYATRSASALAPP